MKDGWLFEGIPRISKNSKQLHLNIHNNRKFVTADLVIKKGFKWNDLREESSLKLKNIADDCCIKCSNASIKDYKCYICGEPSFIAKHIIRPCIVEWFKYTHENESFHFMCAWTFYRNQIPIPRDVAVLIGKKIKEME